MLAQLPRKPVFPEHIIATVRSKIESDVQNQVIPVSAEYKLKEKLAAIPKPTLVDYEDRISHHTIFYQLADIHNMPLKYTKCPLCNTDYNNKSHKPVQCKFCGIWNCVECICPRKRYHPRAKQSNSERYEICYRCDDKFLNLILNHPFYENQCLLEELIGRVRAEKDAIEDELIKDDEESTCIEQSINSNKNTMIEIKQEKKEIKKQVKQLKADIKMQACRNQERSKYLKQLMDLKQQQQLQKKQKVQEDKKKQMKITTQVSVGGNQVQEKPTRTLSHNKVLSEAIYQQPALQQKEVTPSETRVPSAIYYPEPEESQDKKLNFFNYHEWGRNSQEEPEEDDYQQTPIKGLESDAGIRTYAPSPNSQNQMQQSEALTQNKPVQIFAKPETPQINMETYNIDDTSSLDEELVEMKKKQLVKAAIRNSQQERKLNDGAEHAANTPQKCTCQIY